MPTMSSFSDMLVSLVSVKLVLLENSLSLTFYSKLHIQNEVFFSTCFTFKTKEKTIIIASIYWMPTIIRSHATLNESFIKLTITISRWCHHPATEAWINNLIQGNHVTSRLSSAGASAYLVICVGNGLFHCKNKRQMQRWEFPGHAL